MLQFLQDVQNVDTQKSTVQCNIDAGRSLLEILILCIYPQFNKKKKWAIDGA